MNKYIENYRELQNILPESSIPEVARITLLEKYLDSLFNTVDVNSSDMTELIRYIFDDNNELSRNVMKYIIAEHKDILVTTSDPFEVNIKILHLLLNKLFTRNEAIHYLRLYLQDKELVFIRDLYKDSIEMVNEPLEKKNENTETKTISTLSNEYEKHMEIYTNFSNCMDEMRSDIMNSNVMDCINPDIFGASHHNSFNDMHACAAMMKDTDIDDELLIKLADILLNVIMYNQNIYFKSSRFKKKKLNNAFLNKAYNLYGILPNRIQNIRPLNLSDDFKKFISND